MSNDTWLPDGYEVPKGGGGNYMKLEDGANKFRILGAPVMGWEYWNKDGKPVRLTEKPDELPEDIRIGQDGKPERIKHFWAFPVWNYRDSKLQILELTQASIQGPIQDLVTSPDWGDPKEYDITITKKGQKLDTEYGVMPSKPTAVPIEAHKAYREARVNLEALFSGGDPFTSPAGSEGGKDMGDDAKINEASPF
jgi:hypothetical protein